MIRIEQTMSASDVVKVWDPLVRVFHWSLVLAFAVAYATGDEDSNVHEWAGYVVMGLIAVRVVWGFVGSRYARFSDFVRGPRAVIAYSLRLVHGQAPRYLGHNPLGSAMIVVLLVSLAVTGVSGWMLQQPEQSGGTLVAASAPVTAAARADEKHDKARKPDDGDSVVEEIHEFFADLSLALVFLHIGGVALSSFLHRENLVRAMFTGRKRR